MKSIFIQDINGGNLNDTIKREKEIEINGVNGERFIGVGQEDKRIILNGTPGNALGAYLNGATIIVNGNAQDAVGDTMNDGKIIVNGSVGDGCGYAMRGGAIYIKGKAQYRAGVHIKEYKEKQPVIIIGETAGSFLGEYQAGGIIVVLNIKEEKQAVGNFCGTGMHGGKIFIRTKNPNIDLPKQVKIEKATEQDLKEIKKYIDEFCSYFSIIKEELTKIPIYVLTPNSSNPYKQLYVEN